MRAASRNRHAEKYANAPSDEVREREPGRKTVHIAAEELARIGARFIRICRCRKVEDEEERTHDHDADGIECERLCGRWPDREGKTERDDKAASPDEQDGGEDVCRTVSLRRERNGSRFKSPLRGRR